MTELIDRLRNEFQVNHAHHWLETGVRQSHAYSPVVIYVECSVCKQRGFRKPERQVVYIWGTGSKT